jgi:mannose-6-phosphate isomerase
MLRGFRPPEEIAELVRSFGVAALLPGHEALSSDPRGLEGFFRSWMELEPSRVEEVLRTLVERSRALSRDLDLGVTASWVLRLEEAFPGDRGVLAPLFLQLLRLEPGEVMFTGPGVLHAYLKGVGVELMTSSDNVLRGGLTVKHCDVPELLAVLRFDPEPPWRLEGAAGEDGVVSFTAPGGLVLSVLGLEPERPLVCAGGGPRILLCTEGEGTIGVPGQAPHPFRRGDSFLVPAAVPRYELRGAARLYRAASSAA